MWVLGIADYGNGACLVHRGKTRLACLRIVRRKEVSDRRMRVPDPTPTMMLRFLTAEAPYALLQMEDECRSGDLD